MAKNDLEKLTVKELHEKCKQVGVKHYNGKKSFTKNEMIEALLYAFNEMAKVLQIDQNEKKENDKEKYLTDIAAGTLVAFKTEDGKVRSAVVENRSNVKRLLKLKTEYGRQFTVSYDDVLWVKTGARWPKGVYELFKGGKAADERENVAEQTGE